jgi:hypothetical protein
MGYDEGEHVKEVFAYFGRAFYEAGVLETGLAMALMQIEFLGKVREKFNADVGKSFDRTTFETDFDTFMHNQHAQTLGNLIKRVAALPEISEPFVEKLREAKKRRDFLGHHYFRERAVEFAKREGRDQMIVELHADGEMFEALDHELKKELGPVREKLGMNSPRFQEWMNRFYAAHGVDPLSGD